MERLKSIAVFSTLIIFCLGVWFLFFIYILKPAVDWFASIDWASLV